MQCLSFQSELIVLAVGLTVLKMVRLAALMVVKVTVFTLLVFKDTICLLFKDTRLLIVILASPVMWFCNLAMQSPPLCPVQSPQLCHNNTLRPQHHLTGWWSRRSKVLESKSAPCWFKPSVINRRLQFFHFYKCLLYMCASPSYSMCQTLYAVYMGKKYLKVRSTM